MAKPELFETSKVGGIVLMVAGVIFMLLTFLDYLQDGKTDGEIVVMNLLFIVAGALWYIIARKSKARDE